MSLIRQWCLLVPYNKALPGPFLICQMLQNRLYSRECLGYRIADLCELASPCDVLMFRHLAAGLKHCLWRRKYMMTTTQFSQKPMCFWPSKTSTRHHCEILAKILLKLKTNRLQNWKHIDGQICEWWLSLPSLTFSGQYVLDVTRGGRQRKLIY